MKKIICLWLACLLTLTMVACGTYNGPLNTHGTGEATPQDTTAGEDDTTQGEDAFTVEVVLNGEAFLPEGLEIYAQWTDGFSFYTALLDEEGKASVTGLDGDYQVTLSNIPDGLSYNPNAYVATNDARHVTVQLYDLDKIRRGGDDLYNCIELTRVGMYQVEITSPDHVVLFEFKPQTNGVYTVESWMDVTANDINPKIDVYYGSTAFKTFAYTLDDGGAASQYTKNFKYEIKIADEGISNSGGGGQAFTFGIRCDSKDGTYPVKVNFVVQINGGFSSNRQKATVIVPELEGIYTAEQYAYLDAHPVAGDFVGMETDAGGYLLFDGKNYGYNEETGFYHKYNEATGKFDGPVVYAYISAACRFLDKDFTHIEDDGNKTLTVSNGTENYKLFVQGFGSLSAMGYFCVQNCPCRAEGNGGACSIEKNCQKCHSECNPCPEAGIGHMGYADVAVNGLCPVNQELKDFLQKLATQQKYFFDGNGWVELHPSVSIQSTDENAWMFACGYYTEQK